MADTSFAAGSELCWVKSQPEGRYELVLNGQTLGWLQHGDYWNSESRAHLAGHTWLFRRPGSALGRTHILQDSESQIAIATYRSNWGGGGTLVFKDGRKFLLNCTGVWRHVWSLANENGDTIVRLEAHSRKVGLAPQQMLRLFSEDEPKILLLVAFVWHELLQSQDEAEMVAVMNATS
jgi:hypothetical protein